MNRTLIGASLIALSAAFATPAMAQADDQSETASQSVGIGDIIVTAQRREENVQNAALSITVVSGDDLRNAGVTNIEALARQTAGIEIQPSGGPYTTFTVRSVSNLSGNAFADPSIAVNLNGVYLATPTTFRGMFYDLERVELLKGPQGTLYGRNATGGAINIITKRPDFALGGSFGVDVGSYDRFDFNAALNVPLSDQVAFRVAGHRASHDGYMSDGTNDEDLKAARASLLYESGDVSVLLSADWSHEGGKGAGATLRMQCSVLGLPGTSCFVDDPYTGVADLDSFYTNAGLAVQSPDPYLDSDYYGVGLNVDWTTSLGTVSLVAGYRKSDVSYRSTATGWQLVENQHPEQKSVELRLASPGWQRFGYVVGAYYLDTKTRAHASSEGARNRNFADQWTNLTGWTGALFTELSYEVTDALRLVGGIRYTYEKKTSNSRRYTLSPLVGPDPVLPTVESGTPTIVVVGDRSWEKVNWKAGIEFDAGEQNLLYANVSTGFKAGGFYYGAPGGSIYEPELVTSYVIGSKNRFFDNRVQFNVEGFYLNYTNQQVSFIKLVGNPPFSTLVTENAGKSHAYGIDLDSQFVVTPTTRLNFQGQYLKSKYDEFTILTLAPPPAARTDCTVSPGTPPQSIVDCSGQTTMRSPKWTLVGGLEQSFPLSNGGQIVAGANARYESSYQSDVSYLPEGMANSSTRINLSLGYEDPRNTYSIRAYVDNLTNEVSITATTQINSYQSLPAFATRLLAPRTYGVRAQVNF